MYGCIHAKEGETSCRSGVYHLKNLIDDTDVANELKPICLLYDIYEVVYGLNRLRRKTIYA